MFELKIKYLRYNKIHNSIKKPIVIKKIKKLSIPTKVILKLIVKVYVKINK